jgi:peptidyl-dipeptidase Dcp
VELPSQLLENWAFESKLLKQYAVHITTGEVVPDRLLRRYRQSQSFNKGFPIVELLAAAYIDLDLHNIKEYSTPIDLAAYEEYMLNTKRGLMPQIEPRYRFPYFKHIFGGGYASGYYSYLWSEVLDKDAYQAFVETDDIFNRKVADRFRERLLSQGGLKDGMELYVDFRDTLPSRVPLLKARDLWVEPVVDSLTADSLRKAVEDILPR